MRRARHRDRGPIWTGAGAHAPHVRGARSPARAHLATRIAAELARLALYQGSLEDAGQHAAAAHAAATEHECRSCGAGIAATLIEVACANGELTVADARRTEGL